MVIGLGTVGMVLGVIVWKSGSAERKLMKQARRDLRAQTRATKAANEASRTSLPDDTELTDWVRGEPDE